MTPLRRILASLAALAVLVEAGVLVAAWSHETVGPHDRVLVRMSYETEDGAVVGSDKDPVRIVPSEPRRSALDLTFPLRDALLGARVGDLLEVTIAEPLAEWNGSLHLPRIHGPFPLRVEVPREAFARAFGEPRPGSVVTVENPITVRADVLAADARSVTYAPRLEEAPWNLTLLPGTATPLAWNATHYVLRLDLPVGAAWEWPRSCRTELYDLAVGSYRVEAVDAERIRLAAAPIPFLDLVGSRAVLRAEVLAIDRWSADPWGAAWQANVRIVTNGVKP